MNNFLSQAKAGEFGILEFFISVIFSLILGAICMFVYRLYFARDIDRNESLAKSFILMAPSITAIFWAIQYSLPLSLGLLGALSFVRFRTPIKKAEDIGFILLVIALSLLSSIYRFFAASILVFIMISAVWARNSFRDKKFLLFRSGTNMTIFLFTLSKDLDGMNTLIKKTLTETLSGAKNYNLALKEIVPQAEGYSIRYSVHIKDFEDDMIANMITSLEKIKDLRKPEVFVDKAIS